VTPGARLVAVPVASDSIRETATGVRSVKSWKTIEPVKAGSFVPLEVCVTLIVTKLPRASVAVTPPVGLSVDTVKVCGSALPPAVPSRGT